MLTGRFRPPHEVLTEAASAADATALLKQMQAAEAMDDGPVVLEQLTAP